MNKIKSILAFVALIMCGGAWAATYSYTDAVVVWDRDFNVTAKHDGSNNIFRIVPNDNTIQEDGTIKITSNRGVLIEFPSGQDAAAYSYLVKYSNLSTPTAKSVLTMSKTHASNGNCVGSYVAENALTCSAFKINNGSETTASYTTDPTLASGTGYFHVALNSGSNVYLWANATHYNTEASGYFATLNPDANTFGICIGGPINEPTNGGAGALHNLVIESIWICKGNYVAVGETKTFNFPSEDYDLTATVSGNTPVAIDTLEWRNASGATASYNSSSKLAIFGSGKVTASAAPTGSNIYIGKGVELDCTSASGTLGTVTGSGTVVIPGQSSSNAMPSVHNATPFQQAKMWTGTVWMKNTGTTALAICNLPNKMGNANSKAKLTGIKGWLGLDGSWGSKTEVVLEDDGDTKALCFSDSGSSRTATIAKLSGTGTFSTGAPSNYLTTFTDVSKFAGVIDVNDTEKVRIGTGTAAVTAGKIMLCGDVELTVREAIAADKFETDQTGRVLKTVENDGLYTYSFPPPVAKIGEGDDAQYFATLEEAISAAQANDEIEILADSSETLTLDRDIILTVAAGKSYTLSGVISSNYNVTKKGAGTLTLSGANTFSGGLTINAGTVKAGVDGVGSTSSAVGTGTVIVGANGTFDVNGHVFDTDGNGYTIESAGTLKNGGSTCYANTRVIKRLELTGDTTIATGARFGMGIDDGGSSDEQKSYIVMNGHTLNIDTSTRFNLQNTEITGGGEIVVKQGAFLGYGKACSYDGTLKTTGTGTLELNNDCKLTFTVQNFELGSDRGVLGSAQWDDRVGDLKVTGTLSTAANYDYSVPHLIMGDGAAIKLANSQRVSTTKFEIGDQLNIDCSAVTDQAFDAIEVPAAFHTDANYAKIKAWIGSEYKVGNLSHSPNTNWLRITFGTETQTDVVSVTPTGSETAIPNVVLPMTLTKTCDVNAAAANGEMKNWEAYVLGLDHTSATAKPIVSSTQTAETGSIKLVDNLTPKKIKGVNVTRKLFVGAAPGLMSEVQDASYDNGFTVDVPTGDNKVKYLKIKYDFATQ